MNTKDRIIDMALRLFNDMGTSAISTNHIAVALEMSPGNLYYHFHNKEEIIRAILKRANKVRHCLWNLWKLFWGCSDRQV